LGAAKLGFVNPLAASMQARFEAVESRLLESGASALTLTGNGLWLRQAEAGGEAILHTPVPPGADMRLVNVTLFRYDATGRFIGRVDARSGALEDGQWRLVDAVVATPNEPARQVATYVLATELTSDRIMDSFSSPETISFWDLPGFIDTMQKAGLPALRHRLEWNRLASSPFMLAAMVLLAGAFSMRPSRQGGVLLLIGAGIAAGFVIYFGSDIVFALGLSQAVPVPLAAWAPALFTALLGGSLLIHMEDG
ncbi:MAG: LptF/LptG family permease, partial [Alphaproteobacteria bacterium]